MQTSASYAMGAEIEAATAIGAAALPARHAFMLALLAIGAANATRVTRIGLHGKAYLATLPPLPTAMADPAGTATPGRAIGERPVRR